jgi:hypothetical protein
MVREVRAPCRPARRTTSSSAWLVKSPSFTTWSWARATISLIRELKGEPRISAEQQMQRARREARGPQVDPKAGARGA